LNKNDNFKANETAYAVVAVVEVVKAAVIGFSDDKIIFFIMVKLLHLYLKLFKNMRPVLKYLL
jgi:hypothetical protein